MTLGAVLDLVMDRPESWRSFHVLFELLMVAGGLTVVITFWLGWWRAGVLPVRLVFQRSP